MPAKLPDDEGKRCPMGFRTTHDTRALIEAAACRSGRSISQEIELRLEASFAEDRMRVIAREEALKAVADSRTVRFGEWNVIPPSQTMASQQLVHDKLNSAFNQCQAPTEAMRQRYELNGKQ